MEPSKVSTKTIVKHCCRVCGKAVEHKKWKALFTVVGLRDRIAEQLLHLSVTKASLSFTSVLSI